MSRFELFTKLKRNDETKASVPLTSFAIWELYISLAVACSHSNDYHVTRDPHLAPRDLQLWFWLHSL